MYQWYRNHAHLLKPAFQAIGYDSTIKIVDAKQQQTIRSEHLLEQTQSIKFIVLHVFIFLSNNKCRTSRSLLVILHCIFIASIASLWLFCCDVPICLFISPEELWKNQWNQRSKFDSIGKRFPFWQHVQKCMDWTWNSSDSPFPPSDGWFDLCVWGRVEKKSLVI